MWAVVFILGLIVLSVASLILLIVNGRVFYWFGFLIGTASVCLGLALAVIIWIFTTIKHPYLIPTYSALLAVLIYLIWNWGFHSFTKEVQAEAKSSKRIDPEKGTFNPFTAPFLAIKTESATKVLLSASVVGSLLILIPAIVLGNNWTGKYVFEVQILGGMVCTSIFLLFCIAVISINVAEYLWVSRLEKECGRRIYLAFWAARNQKSI